MVKQVAPKVSVIIPAYNATATLARTLESLIPQTLTEWEAIIIDDASSDGTLKMARAFEKRDARFRVIALETNGRQSAARNRGFAEARGTWLAVLDADDAFTPERLEVMVAHAEANDLDMVADNQLFYDAPLGVISRAAADVDGPVRTWTLVQHLREEKVGKSFKWGLMKPIIRREFLQSLTVGYRPEFHMGEDSLLYMELLAQGARAEILPNPMYVYTTARGEISGLASGFSTSRYKFDEHYATYTYFKNRYDGELDAEASKALEACMAAAVNFEESMRFKTDLKARKVKSALQRLAKHPGLVAFLWRGLWKFMRYRLPHKVMRLMNKKSA